MPSPRPEHDPRREAFMGLLGAIGFLKRRPDDDRLIARVIAEADEALEILDYWHELEPMTPRRLPAWEPGKRARVEIDYEDVPVEFVRLGDPADAIEVSLQSGQLSVKVDAAWVRLEDGSLARVKYRDLRPETSPP